MVEGNGIDWGDELSEFSPGRLKRSNLSYGCNLNRLLSSMLCGLAQEWMVLVGPPELGWKHPIDHQTAVERESFLYLFAAI